MTIRLELAREPGFPAGSAAHGYEFVAPLDADGQLDPAGWRSAAQACRVRRFWPGEDDEHGRLVHHRGGRWAFHYDGTEGEDEEEPIFRFDRHRFMPGDYVSITEHDGVQRTFRVATVLPAS
jgi:hypothetical protein